MPVPLCIMTSWLRIFVVPILSQALCFVLSYFYFVQTPISPKTLECSSLPLCVLGIRIFFTVEEASAFSSGPLSVCCVWNYQKAFEFFNKRS